MEKALWPDGNHCCVSLSFDVDAEWVFMGNDPKVAHQPRKLSLGEYEWRSNAIGRILDLLDEYRIKATFFAPGINAENHPEVMKTLLARGHEVACHGWQHEDIARISKEEEKERLLKTIRAVEKATGKRPAGNRTAGGDLSPHTMDLLWENGLIYDSSMRGHDLPYRLKKPNSQEEGLVIVPSYYETDDFHLFADYPGVAPYHGRMLSPQTGYEIWTTAFDGFYKFGLCYTTMFHPQIIGKPGNIMLLDRLLTYIKKFPRVWFATAEEIARYWISKKS